MPVRCLAAPGQLGIGELRPRLDGGDTEDQPGQGDVLDPGFPPIADQEDIADLLRGTPRLNVPITRIVSGVSASAVMPF